ncbi:hypothetical protein EV192_1021097 [Actinocrispum wychmicini]|uniref:Helix-turn-helix protein n=2 Tax=Actinocrispum wychmicini TaxID=1213861 RepID=A0A4R2JZU3_9PSEU|nr:hypothetical protein EV192_1021097 [Actinocrispum wychmicini]
MSRLVKEAYVEQGMQLKDVALQGDIPQSTLRRVLNKPDTPLTALQRQRIEKGANLVSGDLDRILTDPNFRPRIKDRPLDAFKSPAEDVIEFLTKYVAAQPQEGQKVRAAVDVIWADG